MNLELDQIKYQIVVFFILLSNTSFSQLNIKSYDLNIAMIDSMEFYSEDMSSDKFLQFSNSIYIIPIKYKSKFYRNKSFYYFEKNQLDSSYYYAIKSKKNHLHESYDELFMEIFDTIPKYNSLIKTKFQKIDSLNDIEYKELNSLFKQFYSNDQCIERILLNQKKYKNDTERDSLNAIVKQKDLSNKNTLDSLIKDYGWINKINHTIQFDNWMLIVIHGKQEYIMNYVRLGYSEAFKNKADWNDVTILMSWVLAPHRKQNKKEFDPFPIQMELIDDLNYQVFLGKSIQKVIDQFKMRGHEKGNRILIKTNKKYSQPINSIYKESISAGLNSDQIKIIYADDVNGVEYKYETIN